MFTFACVIPTHGRPVYLLEALRSVVAQTLLPTDIIVVDDIGSSETKNLVESLKRQYPSIALSYLNRNIGIPGASASRNFGAKQNRADFIAFLDDDDYWDPSHLCTVASALSSGRFQMALAGMWVLERDGAVKPHYDPMLGHSVDSVIARNPGITGSNLVVDSGTFEAMGGFDSDLPVSNDKDFFLRFLEQGYSYCVTGVRTVTHRRHVSGQLTEWNSKRAEGLKLYISKHSSRLSRRDRRFLEAQILNIEYQHTAGVRKILLGLAQVVRLPPAELLGRIRRRASSRSERTI